MEIWFLLLEYTCVVEVQSEAEAELFGAVARTPIFDLKILEWMNHWDDHEELFQVVTLPVPSLFIMSRCRQVESCSS